MYPGFHSWWRHQARRHGASACEPCSPGWTAFAVRHAGFGHRSHDEARGGDLSRHEDGSDVGGSAFGVRRPLRFLGYKLGLDERQSAEMARILDDLKTERAQAEVDRRRTVAAFADAIAGDTFAADRAAEGGSLRVQSAERLRDAVLRALARIHALLDEEQRARLAYLVRTGALQL